jgi:hypothetical protein
LEFGRAAPRTFGNLHFVWTEDTGKWAGTPRGADAGEEDGDILKEEESVEGPEGLDGKSDGVVGELAILDEVEYVRSNLRTTEGIGRGVVKLGQIRDPMDISERAPAGTQSGVAGALGGWLPSLTFHVRFPKQDHQDCHRPPITPESSNTPSHPDMTEIQTETAMTSGTGHATLAGESSTGVPLMPIEPSGPANGRQPARRVAMRTSPVAGSRR